MTLKLVDESDIKMPEKRPGKFPVDIIDKDEIETKDEIEIKDEIIKDEKQKIIKIPETKGMKFVSKDNIVECERSAKLGVTDNCAICQAKNNEIFKKCPNKWK